MLIVSVSPSSGGLWEQVIESGAVVGRDKSCDVRLGGWRVALAHARLLRTAAGVLVEDLGSFTGVKVDGQRIEGTFGPLKPESVISIASFDLRARQWAGDDEGAITRLDRCTSMTGSSTEAAPLLEPDTADADGHRDAGVVVDERVANPTIDRAGSSGSDLSVVWRRRVHARLLETMDLRRRDVSSMSDERLRRETSLLLEQIVHELQDQLPVELDRAALHREVLDEAVGLGPLETLLADDSITEIMVNRHDQIFVERAGRLEHHSLRFTDDAAVLAVIERIVAPIGRRIDEASPMVDARLRDGSRVHAVIPPLAIHGPCITVRKFARRVWTSDELVRMGTMSADMATFLRLCVRARRSIVVSGGTGSGKTTLLNVLSNHIPLGERVITVEDAAELQLQHPHLVSLEARPANSEGKGAISIRELVRNTLRMRPDRIVVGECRGPEALDMLQAMNTGHEGSLTTLHANAPRDALARLETLVLMAGMDLPLPAVREQIASAVDIVVQQTRFACGARVVTSITEVTGVESGTIQTQELFRFHPRAPSPSSGRTQGFFSGCDAVPECQTAIRSAGFALDLSLFISRSGDEERT